MKKKRDEKLKRNLIISGGIGLFLGIISIFFFFSLSSYSFPKWLENIFLFPFVLIPTTIAENYCELSGDHTFGCFGSSALLSIIIYNIFLVISIFLIYYFTKKWIEIREKQKKDKRITFLTVIISISLLLFGILIFFTTYFEGWIEPDMCEKSFLEEYNVALKEGNLDFCNEFRERRLNTPNTRHSCYLKLPEESTYEDPDYLFTEEDCFQGFAKVMNTPKLCEKTYVDGCDTCFYFCLRDVEDLPDNPEMCETLSNNFFKEKCYDYVFDHYYEFEICNRVSDKFLSFCNEHIESNRQTPYFKNTYSKKN